MLAFAMIFHFLVDALCGSTMLGCVVADLPENAFELVMLYNSLAFATQILTGWLADRVKHDRWLWVFSIVIVCIGATGALRIPWLATVLLGLGNSLFHVSAGREVIRHYAHRGKGRACELGLFVAPGALGIGLGCMFPEKLYVVSLGSMALLFLVFVWIWPTETTETDAVEKTESVDIQCLLAAIVMTFCVFCRAASGFCTEAPWKASITLSVLCFVLVMGGKKAGGFVGDRFGHWLTGIAALAVSWALFAFGGSNVVIGLSAQFIANLMMAITLYILVRLYPSSPGLMFGLAAAVLFPGWLMQFLPNHGLVFNIAYLLAAISFGVAWWLCRRARRNVCI
jgi:FSR family fosmidomycin resistance protein-like MFS transporter